MPILRLQLSADWPAPAPNRAGARGLQVLFAHHLLEPIMWQRFPMLIVGVILGCGGLTTLLAKPPSRIQWSYDIKAAYKVAAKQKKPLVIVVGGPGCGYCKLMDQNTLCDPALVDFVNKRFVAVHLDYERNRKECEILQVESLPTTIVLSTDAEVLGEMVGYRDKSKFRIGLNDALKASQELQTAGAEK